MDVGIIAIDAVRDLAPWLPNTVDVWRSATLFPVETQQNFTEAVLPVLSEDHLADGKRRLHYKLGDKVTSDCSNPLALAGCHKWQQRCTGARCSSQ